MHTILNIQRARITLLITLLHIQWNMAALWVLSQFENLSCTKTTTTILVSCCLFIVVPSLHIEQSSLQALTGVMRDVRYIHCCMLRGIASGSKSFSFNSNPQLVAVLAVYTSTHNNLK